MRSALLAVLAFLGILSIALQWIGWLGGIAIALWRWDWRAALVWFAIGLVCGSLTDGISWLIARLETDGD